MFHLSHPVHPTTSTSTKKSSMLTDSQSSQQRGRSLQYHKYPTQNDFQSLSLIFPTPSLTNSKKYIFEWCLVCAVYPIYAEVQSNFNVAVCLVSFPPSQCSDVLSVQNEMKWRMKKTMAAKSLARKMRDWELQWGLLSYMLGDSWKVVDYVLLPSCCNAVIWTFPRGVSWDTRERHQIGGDGISDFKNEWKNYAEFHV